MSAVHVSSSTSTIGPQDAHADRDNAVTLAEEASVVPDGRYSHSQGTNEDGPLAGIPPPRLTYGLLPPEDVEAAMAPAAAPEAPAAKPGIASRRDTPAQLPHTRAADSALKKCFLEAIGSADLQRAVELVAASGSHACAPLRQLPLQSLVPVQEPLRCTRSSRKARESDSRLHESLHCISISDLLFVSSPRPVNLGQFKAVTTMYGQSFTHRMLVSSTGACITACGLRRRPTAHVRGCTIRRSHVVDASFAKHACLYGPYHACGRGQYNYPNRLPLCPGLDAQLWPALIQNRSDGSVARFGLPLSGMRVVTCRSGRDLHVLRGPAFFKAASAAGDAGVVIDYLRALPRGAAVPSTYQHAISAARALRDQRVVFAVLDTMEEDGAVPDSHHLSNALAVCKATGDVDAAFQRFGQMTAEGVPVDTHVLTALVAACAAHIRKLRDERRRARADSLAGRLEVRPPPSFTDYHRLLYRWSPASI